MTSTQSPVKDGPVVNEQVCAQCAAPVTPGELFCESCGAELAPSSVLPVPVPLPVAVPVESVPVAAGRRAGVVVQLIDLDSRPTHCAQCQGTIADDGYCELCGAPAQRPRDHWAEQPAPWAAAVCDRGIRHTRNEDAVALAATTEPVSLTAGEVSPAFAALVVCDGVSSSTDPDLASVAAVRAARDVLIALPQPSATPVDLLIEAAAAANQAVVDTATSPTMASPPACTFVAAVLRMVGPVTPEGAPQPELTVAWIGDSRAYWLPDQGEAVQLTTDDSWASEAIALGMSRQEAERTPQAHAITRWLGIDAPQIVPHTVTRTLDQSGRLLVCSDGLWNYCSAAQELATLVQSQLDAGSGELAELARSLVQWANDQGGQDNVTVALARIS